MVPRAKYDESGNVVGGLFFEVAIPFVGDREACLRLRDDEGFSALAKWPSPMDATFVSEVDDKPDVVFVCPKEPMHKFVRRIALQGNIAWGETTTKVVCGAISETFFVQPEFAEAIQAELHAGALGGFEVRRMKHTHGWPDPTPIPWLLPDACIVERALIAPANLNACQKCYRAPLFCSACGSRVCPQCGHITVGSGLNVFRPDEKKLRNEILRDRMPAAGIVLNAERWKGEDFLAMGRVGVITGRFAKYLFEQEAEGIWIRPAQAYFPDEQYRKLEAQVAKAVWKEGPRVVLSNWDYRKHRR
jgi:hypothetical protein